MGGYKQHDPAVYVVGWREFGVIKAGYSCNQRWRKFVLRDAELLALRFFDVAADAFAFESELDSVLTARGPIAFPHKGSEAARLLGSDCGGYLECHRVDPSEWPDFLAEHCYGAYTRASAAQHYHGRTDVTDVLRTASPTRDNQPFVTRGRTYGDGWMR